MRVPQLMRHDALAHTGTRCGVVQFRARRAGRGRAPATQFRSPWALYRGRCARRVNSAAGLPSAGRPSVAFDPRTEPGP